MTDRTVAPFSPIPRYEISEINIREYFFVILKRRRIILSILILSLTCAAVYTFLKTPIYRSSAKINIDLSTYSMIPEVISQKSQQDMFWETQLALLQSRTLATRVQKRLNLTPQDLASQAESKEVESEWSAAKPEDRLDYVIEQLGNMLQVSGIKNTTLIEIALLTPAPELSQTLAQTWAQEYVEYSLASQYEYSRKAEELLAERIKQLQKEISEKQKLFQDYSSQEQVILLENARSINSNKLEDLNKALSEATSERISKEVAYRDIQIQGKNALPEIRNSPVIQRLKQEYALLGQQYSEKSGLYLPDFPVMQSLRRQMDQLQKAMDEEASDLFAKVSANARADYQVALKNEVALKSEVERVKGETIVSRQQEFNYDRLKIEVDEKRRQLESLLEKQSEATASVQAKEMKATTIRIVEDAQLPKRKYKPDVLYNISLSLAFGLIFGIGFAFLSDYLDRSFKNIEDLERHAQLPFLGIIPRYQVGEDNNGKAKTLMKREGVMGVPSESIDLLTLYNPDSIESEAFRTIRASLLVSFPESPPRSILVTSGQTGEGKTFVACNLAVTLAQLEKKVVLVDADLRNPRIHRIWRLSNDTGLARFLTSDVSATEVTRRSHFDGVCVITSGAKTPRPTELLSSKRFDELLEQLQTQFDHIIIDSPPVIPVSDPLVLASKCNCVVLVIRAGVTAREVVQLAKQKLTHFDATIAGAVLNGIDLMDPYYHFTYYSTYGRYYEK